MLAKYNSQLLLQGYDLSKHQQQDKTSGVTVSTAPDLTQPTVYGHIDHTQWSPKATEVRLSCRPGPKAEWFSITAHQMFDTWNPGLRGIYGTELVRSRYTEYPGWAVVAKNGTYSRDVQLCGATEDKSKVSGLAYCNGKLASTTKLFENVQVQLAFNDKGVMAIGCNGEGSNNGANLQWEGQVWIRVPGNNSIQLNGTVRKWKDGTVARSCQEYHASVGGQYSGQTGSGVYEIKPEASEPAFSVFCSMKFRDGGWTLAFVKNTPAGMTSLQKAMSTYYRLTDLVYSPEDSARSSSKREGWVNLNVFPFTEFFVGIHDRTPSKANNCIEFDRACSVFYQSIYRKHLKLNFGQTGAFLSSAPDTSASAIRHNWCGGNLPASPNCNGANRGEVGVGIHFNKQTVGYPHVHSHIYLCGPGGRFCYGISSQFGISRDYGQTGTAVGIWVR